MFKDIDTKINDKDIQKGIYNFLNLNNIYPNQDKDIINTYSKDIETFLQILKNNSDTFKYDLKEILKNNKQFISLIDKIKNPSENLTTVIRLINNLLSNPSNSEFKLKPDDFNQLKIDLKNYEYTQIKNISQIKNININDILDAKTKALSTNLNVQRSLKGPLKNQWKDIYHFIENLFKLIDKENEFKKLKPTPGKTKNKGKSKKGGYKFNILEIILIFIIIIIIIIIIYKIFKSYNFKNKIFDSND